MDESAFEHAARLEQHMRDAALAVARQKEQAAHRMPVDFDGTCGECGDDIPRPRIALGYFVCVDCVVDRERRAKLHH